MKVLSCNLRDARALDGDNAWPQRRDLCLQILRRQQADVICCQELCPEPLRDLQQGLPEYMLYTVKEAPDSDQTPNAILFHRERFQLLGAGAYWLSEYPQQSGSRSWNSGYIRLAVWVHLRERASGKQSRILNTHLDDSSRPAREKQAEVLLAESAAWTECAVQILAGDMNADAGSPVIVALSNGGWQDTYLARHQTLDPGFTYHAFQGDAYDPVRMQEDVVGKMDWIFTRGPVRVGDADVIREHEGRRFPSDHYFVSADIDL